MKTLLQYRMPVAVSSGFLSPRPKSNFVNQIRRLYSPARGLSADSKLPSTHEVFPRNGQVVDPAIPSTSGSMSLRLASVRRSSEAHKESTKVLAALSHWTVFRCGPSKIRQ